MPHCTKCGAEVPGDRPVLPDLRTASARRRPVRPLPARCSPIPPPATSGLSENAAACLSYVLGWITGIIFYPHRSPALRSLSRRAVDRHLRRPAPDTHRAGHDLWHGLLLGRHWRRVRYRLAAHRLHRAAGVCAVDRLMIKAYQGERFMVPIAGDIAVNLANQ